MTRRYPHPVGGWVGLGPLGSDGGIIHDPSSLPSNPTQVKAVLPTANNNELVAVAGLCLHRSYARPHGPLNNKVIISDQLWRAGDTGTLDWTLSSAVLMRRDAMRHTSIRYVKPAYVVSLVALPDLRNCAVSLRTEVSIKWTSPQHDDSVMQTTTIACVHGVRHFDPSME